jgi:threonine/homoserine/homoserine lactone efflux protein
MIAPAEIMRNAEIGMFVALIVMFLSSLICITALVIDGDRRRRFLMHVGIYTMGTFTLTFLLLAAFYITAKITS